MPFAPLLSPTGRTAAAPCHQRPPFPGGDAMVTCATYRWHTASQQQQRGVVPYLIFASLLRMLIGIGRYFTWTGCVTV